MVEGAPSPVWDSHGAYSIDSKTIQEGTEAQILMERAGGAVVTAMRRFLDLSNPILILAGGGNNGGDALVVARILAHEGLAPRVILISADKTEPNLVIPGAEITIYEPGILTSLICQETILVDGILGLGLKGALKPGRAFDCLNELANTRYSRCVAIDIPSGLSADAWNIEGPALVADLTVTFGAKKPCHVLEPTKSMCGEVVVCDIGFANTAVDELLETTPQIHEVAPRLVFQAVRSPADIHKYQKGHALVIGGSPGKMGAPLLAGHAAWRLGAGWLSLALPSALKVLPHAPAEATYEDFYAAGVLDTEAMLRFVADRKVCALVIGPGMIEPPLDSNGWNELANLQRQLEFRLVIDAGALVDWLNLSMHARFAGGLTLLTPHPGEWLKLDLSNSPSPLTSLEEVKIWVSQLANRGLHCIYKSSTPLVFPTSQASALAWCISASDAKFAKAGMGDLLAGGSAAMALSGLSMDKAAVQAQALIYSAGYRLLAQGVPITPDALLTALRPK